MDKFTITRVPVIDGIPTDWDRFVDESDSGCLFLQSRYFTLQPILKWRPVCYRVTTADGQTVLWQALVYERKIRFGIRVAMPGVNTPVMGFIPAGGIDDDKLLEASLEALITRLRADYRLCVLPLAWRFPHTNLLRNKPGVSLLESGTTVLEYRDGLDAASLLKACQSNRRWSIRRAEKVGIIILTDPGERYTLEFLQLYEDTFRRQGINPPMSADELLTYCNLIVERKIGRLSFAISEEKVAAAMLSACDNNYDYYLIGVYDEDLKVTNAQSLLVYSQIAESIKRGRGFDFEGSKVPGIRSFFESFGAKYVPSPVCLLRSGLAGLWLSRRYT
ncbi:GNAT family N-acetyltransferase [Gemmatimonadota bacterium]